MNMSLILSLYALDIFCFIASNLLSNENLLLLQCSKSCGPGERYRYVDCRYREQSVAGDYCRGHTKPNANEKCELVPCGQWRAGEWSEVSITSAFYISCLLQLSCLCDNYQNTK